MRDIFLGHILRSIAFIPAFILMIVAAVKGVKGMKAEQKKIDFTVDLTCQECGHIFQVPLHVYGKHLFSISKSVKKSANIGGVGISTTQVQSEARQVNCDQCQMETYCQWTNIDDFPMDYRKQITLAGVRAGIPYFLAAAIWGRLVTWIINIF